MIKILIKLFCIYLISILEKNIFTILKILKLIKIKNLILIKKIIVFKF